MNTNNTSPSLKPNSSIYENETDFWNLLESLWREKVIIFSITVFCSVLSIFYALKLPDIYKTQVILAPADVKQSSGLSALSGQFGGLASLAGINMNSSGSNAKLALEIIKSRKFINDFVEKHNILIDLFAAESWNVMGNSIIYDAELYDTQLQKWVREVQPPKKAIPSLQEAYEKFIEIMQVIENQDTGIVTISVEHVSPYIAREWVEWIVQDINQTMKIRDVKEAVKSKKFLTEQLKQTRVADMRSILYKLIEEQSKTIMFAEVRDEYVFKTIDPALVPEKKSGPKRALICVLGAFLGALLGIFIVLLKGYFRENLKKSRRYN